MTSPHLQGALAYRWCLLPLGSTASSYRATRTQMRAQSTKSSPDRTYYYLSVIDSWIIENLEKYRKGGYHPVVIGDILKDRYHIVHKLGHGSFSTIWLAHDKEKKSYVALKINIADFKSDQADLQLSLSDPSYIEDPGWPMIPILKDHFKSQSANGCHECYVTSPARVSLAKATETSSFSIDVARSLVAQLVHTVAYIQSRGIVHGDIHFGNILIDMDANFDKLSVSQLYQEYGEPPTEALERSDEQPLTPGVPTHATEPIWLGKMAHKFNVPEARLVLSDFGEAFSPLKNKQPKLGKDCSAPRYCLPPEAYFEPEKPISFAIDIWTLACAIWNIFTGRIIFSSWFGKSDEITSQQIELLGPLPPEWWAGWKAKYQFFDEFIEPKQGRETLLPFEEQFIKEMEDMARTSDRRDEPDMDMEEMKALLRMLRSMLIYRPELRATASMILESDWMVHWGSPSYEVRGNVPGSWLPVSTAISHV
ncbi:hypothetical protein N7456_003453 [Penicillium angulare]|uniref:non-specific serine/threonine protein kinase n=1 Tax=Penicillium angulare TaxID=116970 RepID=A0A9W9FUU1_9EURO|nr:hypothetical protein N7456_003453 [Penicillium angulare]